MIEDSPVVSDIRQIRRAIFKRFDHDPDRYIDYLRALEQTSQSVMLAAKEEQVSFPRPETQPVTLP